MKLLFILLLLLCATSLFSLQTADSWYPGTVKLMDGTELVGDVNYNLPYQKVSIKIDGQTTTLRENQLSSLIILTEKFRHEFWQVTLKNEQGEDSHIFAKMIYRSRKKFSLYKEYFAVTEDFDINPNTGIQTIRERLSNLNKDAFMPDPKLGISMDFRLFLADTDGNSQPISSTGFSNAYGSCFQKIKNFIFRNRLTVRKEEDLVRIIRYADSLTHGCSDN